MTPDFPATLRAAEAHLSAASPQLATLIAAHGPCTLAPESDLFRVLVRAVVSQLLSTAAARTINVRLETAVKRRVTPTAILKLTDEQLRACGLSGAKCRSIRELAEHFKAKRGFARQVAAASDDAIRELLLPFHGIGHWTVDMVLIFSICRLDVLPVGDLGFRAGMRDLFGLPDLPSKAEAETLAEPWRPYRSVATWYLWRSRG